MRAVVTACQPHQPTYASPCACPCRLGSSEGPKDLSSLRSRLGCHISACNAGMYAQAFYPLVNAQVALLSNKSSLPALFNRVPVQVLSSWRRRTPPTAA